MQPDPESVLIILDNGFGCYLACKQTLSHRPKRKESIYTVFISNGFMSASNTVFH